MAKLDQIVLPELAFDGTPLPEVVRFLQEQARKLDPEGKGLNFIINSQLADLPPAQVSAPGATAAQAAPPATVPQFDLATVQIKLSLPLRDLKLAHALDAIVKAADKPIKFSVEEYAVVFSSRLYAAPLNPRVFKVDPNTFSQGLQGVVGTTPLVPGASGPSGQAGQGQGVSGAGVGLAPGGQNR
jgi:hypothetical protein